MYITSTLPVVFITFILASIQFYKIVVRLHHWTQTISFYISYFIYASQNHRVWKCFQRSFSPTSCSGQGHQDQVAQGCIHKSIETFKGRKYHHLWETTSSTWLPSYWKYFFLKSNQNFPCPLPFFLPLSISGKSLALSPLRCPVR